MRIVLDTNQFVSALIRPDGDSAQILQMWRQRKIEIAVSKQLLEELFMVLQRTHIKDKYELTDQDITRYLQLLQRYAFLSPGELKVQAVKDDVKDNFVIACALEAGAKCIVSGDRHLLSIGKYQDIKILRAAEFVQMFKSI